MDTRPSSNQVRYSLSYHSTDMKCDIYLWVSYAEFTLTFTIEIILKNKKKK
jgi:hypothetical protein